MFFFLFIFSENISCGYNCSYNNKGNNIKIITIIVIIIIINYFYIVITVALIIGKSYSHQEKGVKNYKSELTINTLVH